MNLLIALLVSAFSLPQQAEAQVLYKVNFHDKSYNRYEGLQIGRAHV